MPSNLLSALLTICCLATLPTACQTHPQKKAGQNTPVKPAADRVAYDSMHLVLATRYTALSAGERQQLRETLRKTAAWPYDILCPDSEPGTHITVKGRLVDSEKKPVPGASLHVFHTDNQGYYSPLDESSGRMLENDPRLEGFITTDSLGRFEIRTVRPANYPKRYEGRLLPQHIHVVVNAADYREGSFQIVFEDDPAMSDHWREWAKNGHHPMTRLIEGVGEVELTVVR